MLILNKKSIANHENQLFQSELEKFRPHQNRLLQATHKQNALMKELTKSYGDLLQDKRVRSEQAKYESYTRQRNAVLGKYLKVFQAFNDLVAGLERAQSFYSEMRETVESLEKNVETFVNNRRSEGAQLLSQIERDKATNTSGQADRERDRLRELMERMSMDPSSSNSPTKASFRPLPASNSSHTIDPYSTKSPHLSSPYHLHVTESNKHIHSPGSPVATSPHEINHRYASSSTGNPSHAQRPMSRESYLPGGVPAVSDPYNPMTYPFQAPTSLPLSQGSYQLNATQPSLSQYPQHGHYLPQGYVPPPPPPGPPPGLQPNFVPPNIPYPSGPGGYAHHQPPPQSNSQQSHNDPWAGLNAWR